MELCITRIYSKYCIFSICSEYSISLKTFNKILFLLMNSTRFTNSNENKEFIIKVFANASVSQWRYGN